MVILHMFSHTKVLQSHLLNIPEGFGYDGHVAIKTSYTRPSTNDNTCKVNRYWVVAPCFNYANAIRSNMLMVWPEGTKYVLDI